MSRDEVSVCVERERLLDVCRQLKEQCGFEMLTDLAGVDHWNEMPRFEVVYHLYSFTHHCRLRLKVKVPENDMWVDSVTGIWRGADWHEREAFDMYGIRFRGHPNLKRILMWDGYPHHPLRKDFPLAGKEAEIRDPEAGAGRVEPAPMEGGPFLPGQGSSSAIAREPRQHETVAELWEEPF